MHHTFLRLLTVCLGLHAVTGAPGTKEVEVVKAPSPYALRGNLKMPGDGDQFVNQGGAMGDIQIIYNVGPASNRSNRADLTAPPFGLAIDVILVPRREKGWNPGPHEVVVTGTRLTIIGWRSKPSYPKQFRTSDIDLWRLS
ncbi:secreted protein [Melampsora americana]|nr:secreted protein [Melampsora americana]